MKVEPMPEKTTHPPIHSEACKDGYRCEISLVLRRADQLFETDLPLPAEHMVLSEPILDFLEASIDDHPKQLPSEEGRFPLTQR